MKFTCLFAIAAIVTVLAFAQGRSVVHRFELWGALHGHDEKFAFVDGFTNGFFAGRREFVPLADCIDSNLSTDQVIAMIDKYYGEHPERWNQGVATELLHAWTVKGSPCAGKNPWAGR